MRILVLWLGVTGDWSLDSATPATSPVWGTTYLGGSRPGACIPDGPFRGLRGRLPVDHCISRGFTSGTPGGMAGMTFEEPPVLAALIAAGTPYSTFADAVELAHNQPHIAVGAAQLLDAEGEPTAPPGDMWSLRVSCGDPAFWLHHAFVDKLWADRQAQRTPTEYNGAHSGRRVSPADVLPPFGVPVSTALTLPCVRYAPFPGGAAGGRRRRRVGGGKGRELRRPAVEAAVTAARAPRAAAEAAFARRAGASAAQVARGAAALVDAATDAVLAGELDVDVSSGPGGEGGGAQVAAAQRKNDRCALGRCRCLPHARGRPRVPPKGPPSQGPSGKEHGAPLVPLPSNLRRSSDLSPLN